MRSNARQKQSGFTLMELMIVVGVSAVLLIISYQVLEESYRTAMSLEARNDLLLLSQQPTNAIQTSIYQARTIFDNDAIGQAYYTRFVAQIPALFTPAPGTLLPNLAPTSSLADDATGTRYVGNCLLIARQMPPVYVQYDHDSNAGTPTVPFPIDRYRFEMFYLRQCNKTSATQKCAGNRGFGKTNFVYDLVRARTIDFADYFQLNPLINPSAGATLTSNQRNQIVAGLQANGLTRAWDIAPGLAITSAFYSINTTAGATAGQMTAQASQTLTLFGTPSSMDPQILRGASITGGIQYSIAFRNPAETEAVGTALNLQPENQDGQFSFTSRMSSTTAGATPIPIISILRVPRFAANDVVTTTFPSGFEVKIGGVGAGQRVLVRVMVMARYGATRYDAQESVIVASKGLSV